MSTSTLTAANHRRQLQELLDETQERIIRLRSDYDYLECTGTDVGAGDDEGGSESDGTFVERDRLRAQIAEDLELVEQIEAALDRAQGRSWRNCVTCGNPIGEERLKALPTTDVCVSCKAIGGGW